MKTDALEAIQHYLSSVSRYLPSLPDARRQEMLSELESYIHDAVRDRTQGREANLQDVSAVLAEMDSPESYAQAPQAAPIAVTGPGYRTFGSRGIPGPLVFGLVALGLMVVGKLVAAAAMGRPEVLIGAVLSGLVLVGLYVGSKVAYVATIVGVVWGTAITTITKGPAIGLATVFVDSLVLVPVVLCKDYFFPKPGIGSEPRP
jgi:hypothetical protein